VRAAVVLDDVRVIHGYILGSLVKLSHRVPAVGHDLGHEHVGLTNARDRRIDEVGLHALPLRDVLLASRLWQGNDVQLLAALHPTRQLALGLMPRVDAEGTAPTMGAAPHPSAMSRSRGSG
jgi:hypothetical protein